MRAGFLSNSLQRTGVGTSTTHSDSYDVEECGNLKIFGKTVQTVLAAELDRLGAGNVPLSISLWQFTFACLYQAGEVRNLTDHWPLISKALEQLYPVVRTVAKRFDYS